MRTSPAGLALIQSLEGFKFKASPDAKGKWSIGHGHDLLPGESYPDGITPAEAFTLLKIDVGFAEHAIETLIHVVINQEQYDSTVSWIYNLGVHSLTTSTMLTDINARHFTDAAQQMLIWCHQGALVTRDLLRRRCTEAVMFLTNCPTDRAA